MNSKQTEFELHFCYKCFQMTNHTGTVCAKCGQENKTIEPTPTVPDDGAEAKAKELVEKFRVELDGVYGDDSAAKQCALICVDEILKTYDGKQSAEYWANNGGEVIFWQQVRTHIVSM